MAKLSTALRVLAEETNIGAMVSHDPLSLVRAYHDPHDQEVVGVLVAGLAYGRVERIRQKAQEVLAVLGPHPAESIRHPHVLRALEGCTYRFQRGDDIPRFLMAVARVRETYGSLAHAFLAHRRSDDRDVADTASRFVGLLRTHMKGPLSNGLRYLIPDPGTGSASKRLLLYLRWMIRGPDAADLGTWPRLASGFCTQDLVMPLDTHIARIGRFLNLSQRRANDLQTAREMTCSLLRVDPKDPVRFDMVLCHLGISGACPIKQDAARCVQCCLRPHCSSAVA
ncbi:MAG: TIGR02757 family protein [Myxococcales bacterium]|nr:TIGR02757 family protein [Myxococcales bacterium]